MGYPINTIRPEGQPGDWTKHGLPDGRPMPPYGPPTMRIRCQTSDTNWAEITVGWWNSAVASFSVYATSPISGWPTQEQNWYRELCRQCGVDLPPL